MIRVALLFFLSMDFSLAAPAALDPNQIQGEYLGNYGSAQEGVGQWGAQIVALDSGGKYRLGFAKGGLPGAGWDKAAQKDAIATASPDRVVFSAGGLSLAVGGSGDSLVIRDGSGGTGLLRKVHRTSPTFKRPAPSGALVLFDGTGTQAWKNGRLGPDSQLNAGATTLRTFRDFNMHAEFKIPFSPATLYPSRGNSGVYLQGRYELQIYDTYGWQPPYDSSYYRSVSIEPEGACGSIYGVAEPRVNATYPPGAWQTFDLSFQAARFDGGGGLTAPAMLSVYQNGILIHDKLALKAVTGGASLPMNSLPGPIFLQSHESLVMYRNIWIEEDPKQPIAVLASENRNQGAGFKGRHVGVPWSVRIDGRATGRQVPILGKSAASRTP